MGCSSWTRFGDPVLGDPRWARVSQAGTAPITVLWGATLTENPWRKFSWIEGYDKPIRQFDAEELISLLDYLGSE